MQPVGIVINWFEKSTDCASASLPFKESGDKVRVILYLALSASFDTMFKSSANAFASSKSQSPVVSCTSSKDLVDGISVPKPSTSATLIAGSIVLDRFTTYVFVADASFARDGAETQGK